MKKKLPIFKDVNRLDSAIEDILFDVSITNAFDSLSVYCQEKKLSVLESDFTALRQGTEKKLSSQLHLYTVLLYCRMQLENDWGDAGEMQTTSSFARHVLKKKADEELSHKDLVLFEKWLFKQKDTHQLHDATQAGITNWIRHFTLSLWGHHFPMDKMEDVNRLLRFIGSDTRMTFSLQGKKQNLIYFTYKKMKVGLHDVIWIRDELVRSPYVITALAAFSYEREVYVRKESLNTIYEQKWLQFLRMSDSEKVMARYHPERAISEGIKQHVFDCYQTHTIDEAQRTKKQMIKDLSETVVLHEFGHVVVNHDVMKPEVGSVIEASHVLGYNIFFSMLELLADFSPKKERLYGPLYNMYRISKANPIRAKRLFYMYVSDVWFYDTEDTYMYDYADLILLILLRYIKEDKEIDFEKIYMDLDLKNSDSLLSELLQAIENNAAALVEMAESAIYTINQEQLSYVDIKRLVYKNFEKHGPIKDPNSYTFLSNYWKLILLYVLKISDKSDAVQRYLEQKKQDELRWLFTRCAGKKEADTYRGQYRMYIMDRFDALGLTLNA